MNNTEIRVERIAGETVEINNREWVVIEETTTDDYRNRGLNNLAAAMEKAGKVAVLYVRKPNGKVWYMAVEFEQGGFTPPVPCP